jgi:3-oxoadipate enol-lactonase
MWASQVAALSDTFRIIRYDHRGHGDSEPNTSAVTIENLADEVVALLDYLDVRTFIFVGSSVGGLIGMSIASRFSDRVRRLVLSNTGPYMPPRERWDKRIEDVRNGAMPELAVSSLKRWLPQTFQHQEPGLCARLLDQARLIDGPSYASMCAAIRDADLRNELNRISTPTLVTASTEDVSPVDAAEELARSIHGAQLHVFQNSGHLPSIDQASEYTSVLRRFIEETSKV